MNSRQLKIVRNIAIAAAAVTLMSPFTTHAASQNAATAMDACVTQFIAGHLADHQGAITVFKEEAAQTSSAAAVHANYTILVAAKKRASGLPLASATCIVNSHGEVLSLKTIASGERLAMR